MPGCFGIGFGPMFDGQHFTPIPPNDGPPSGSIAFFDFAHGVYWTQAAGNLTAADVISDTGAIVPDIGYTGGSGVSLLEPAYVELGLDKTIVLRGRIILEDSEAEFASTLNLIDEADSGDYNAGLTFSVRVVKDSLATPPLSVQGRIDGYDASNSFSVSTEPVAVALDTEFRFDTAYNPGTQALSTLGSDPLDATTPPGSAAITLPSIGLATLVDSGSLPAGTALALDTIVVYPAVPDADLPTLSAG